MSSKFSTAKGGVFQLNDGNVMPLIGVGTYGLYNQPEIDAVVDTALQEGYRLFDTAKFYRNERELNTALQKLLPKHNLQREDIFIETKVHILSEEGVLKTTRNMVLDSFKAFKTTYLDLVLIHYPKCWSEDDKNKRNRFDRSDAYGMLEHFKKDGRIRSIGVSNFESRHIDQLVKDGHCLPAVNQCEFHPHLTRPDLVNYCREKNIFFQAHTSLAKHSPSLYSSERLCDIARKHQLSIEQTLLGFAYWQQVGIIPKSRNPPRIVSNLYFLDEKLDDKELKILARLDASKNYSDCAGWNVL